MICINMILLNGWCRSSMRDARLVSYAFLYTTHTLLQKTIFLKNLKSSPANIFSFISDESILLKETN